MVRTSNWLIIPLPFILLIGRQGVVFLRHLTFLCLHPCPQEEELKDAVLLVMANKQVCACVWLPSLRVLVLKNTAQPHAHSFIDHSVIEHASTEHAFIEHAFIGHAFTERAFIEHEFIEHAFIEHSFIDSAFIENAFIEIHSLKTHSLTLNSLK